MADSTPAVEPRGPISWPMVQLARLIAETAEFQARCQVDSIDDALRFIHYPSLLPDQNGKIKRPFAVVEIGEEWEMIKIDGDHMRPQGSLFVIFSDDMKYPDRLDLSELDFCNFVGVTCQEMGVLQGQDTRLSLRNIKSNIPPGIPPAAERGGEAEYWACRLLVEWGRL